MPESMLERVRYALVMSRTAMEAYPVSSTGNQCSTSSLRCILKNARLFAA